jgi:hypothetical protein
MADAVTTQVLYESASDYVAKFTNVSDGTGEAAVTKVDVSALSPAAAELDLVEIIYATAGMSVQILFGATADVVAWLVPPDQHGKFNFRKIEPGKIRNNAGTGKTGDIKFTTVGHTAGDTYSIILVCKKRLTAEV